MPRLQNKIAVVTGGSSGIGLATAQRFVEEGAFVFITGRRQAELDKAVSLIGRNVIGVQGDISNLDDTDRLITRICTSSSGIASTASKCAGRRLRPIRLDERACRKSPLLRPNSFQCFSALRRDIAAQLPDGWVRA